MFFAWDVLHSHTGRRHRQQTYEYFISLISYISLVIAVLLATHVRVVLFSPTTSHYIYAHITTPTRQYLAHIIRRGRVACRSRHTQVVYVVIACRPPGPMRDWEEHCPPHSIITYLVPGTWYDVQGASLRGRRMRHTPPATLAQEGKKNSVKRKKKSPSICDCKLAT